MESYITIIISVISLFVSIISIYKANKAQTLQNRLNEIELQIRSHDLEELKQDQKKNNNACIEARVVDFGNKKHKLKMWNSGRENAYNISASFSEDSGVIITDKDAMPFEMLEPGKSFEIPVIIYPSASCKYTVITRWEDSNSCKYDKTQYGTI